MRRVRHLLTVGMALAAVLGTASDAALAVPPASDAALAVPPATAAAQSSSQATLYGFGSGKATPFTVVQIPARITGSVVVRFRGDPATGCAARGLCRYTGSVLWTPPPAGSLTIFQTRSRPARKYQLDLSLTDPNGAPGNGQAVTDADVQQAPPAPGSTNQPGPTCADATSAAPDIQLGVRRGRVRFSLAQATPSPLQTRCAGPLIADVASALPAPTASLRATLGGAITLHLAGAHRFAAHGFAGTVDSTLTIRLGRPQRVLSVGLRSKGRTERYREVQLDYRATLAGSVTTAVRGDAEPGLCAPLGACGLHGTLSVAPAVQAGQASIQAYGPASRPTRDFLTALGLSKTGRAHGIAVAGQLAFTRGGVITAHIDQGSVSCRDSAALGGSSVQLSANRGRLLAQYVTGQGLGNPLRTRCPGPFGPQTTLASGSAPLGVLALRRATLSLDRSAPFIDDGYRGGGSAHLTLTLRRRRLRTLLFRLSRGER